MYNNALYFRVKSSFQLRLASPSSPRNLSVSALSFSFPARAAYFPPLTPFLDTLDAASQIAENPATLSPLPATLRGRVKPKSCVCHSYEKTPVVGYPTICEAQKICILHPLHQPSGGNPS